MGALNRLEIGARLRALAAEVEEGAADPVPASPQPKSDGSLLAWGGKVSPTFRDLSLIHI